MAAGEGDEVEALRAEVRALKEQLDNRAKVAARALAAHQRRVERLSEALRSLEEKDRRISEDLEQARHFQERLLSAVPGCEGLTVGAVSRPADQVGGDLYVVHTLAAGTLRVFVGDAIGHGVQAALRTMILKSEYDRVRELASPEAVLEALNARLVALYPGLEMQCAAACLDVTAPMGGKAGRVRYASAALPPLLHLPKGRAAGEHYRPGSLLGVAALFQVSPEELTLAAGDRVAVYSDGLVEAWDTDGAAFSLGAVIEGLSAAGAPQGAVDALFGRLLGFVGSRGLDDDATCVLIAAEERAALSRP